MKALAAAQKKAGSDHEGAWNNNATPFVADGLLYAQTDAGIVALK